MYSILVVDDEPELRQQLTSLLQAKGYQVDEAADGAEAVRKLLESEYNLVLCDVRMPHMDGHQFLKFVREHELPTTVALITAHANVRDAIQATKDGVFDYIEKPIAPDTVLSLVQRAEAAYIMLSRMKDSAPRLLDNDKECVGNSRGMRKIFSILERLSKVNTSVLIRGENGTGKELVARALHFNSPRKNEPFVAVNCGAIPENLVESELFGHEKGAFTGADQRRIGKFQHASGGTLFLDEIGDMSPATQVKLLRVLQEHAFTPVGSLREVKAEVRVIAATHQDLEKLIQTGQFREDLFYRLNVVPLYLPSLRERKEDIPMLARHFLEKFNREHGNQIQGISQDTLEALTQFHWPGNIRELENAIEHAFVVEQTNEITFFSLPEYIRKVSSKSFHDLPNKLRQTNTDVGSSNPKASFQSHPLDWEKGKKVFERDFIVQALRTHGGKINHTAEKARIPKNTLLRKIKKYSINPKEYGGTESDLSSNDTL